MRSQTARNDLAGLTMVRFVAALGVVWYHYGLPMLPSVATPLHNLAASGYVGVLLFFILSGFILVYVSSDRDLAAATERSNFWWRRVARIYPVYVLAWLLFGVFVLVDGFSRGAALGQLLKWSTFFGGTSLTLVQAWIPGAVVGWNRPGWSLSVEAFFYASFPLIFLWTRRLGVAALTRLLVASWVAGAAIMTLVEWSAHPLLAGTFLQTTWREYLQNFPPFELPLFVSGVALGGLYVRGVRLSHPALWLAGCAVLLVMTLSLPALLGVVPRDVLLLPEFSALIYMLALVSVPTTGLWASPAVLLGKASYALYILQAPMWGLYLHALGRSASDPRSWPELFLFGALLIAASVLVHLYVERPAERWINSYHRRAQVAGASGRTAGS